MSFVRKIKSILRKSNIRNFFNLRKIVGLKVSGVSYTNNTALFDDLDEAMVIVDIDLGQTGDKKILINGKELHTTVKTGGIRLQLLPETTWEVVQSLLSEKVWNLSLLSLPRESAWVNPPTANIFRMNKNRLGWESLEENVIYVYSVYEKDTSNILPLSVFVNLGDDGDKNFLINSKIVSGTQTGCRLFFVPPNAAYGLFSGFETIPITTPDGKIVKNHPANLY